ncbi:MAG: nitroreductase/quinone reductase family protein [Anaerolineae bacterium]
MWFNPIMEWLLKSPLHPLISSNTMLITYTGHKSGRLYTTPVNYLRDGDVFTTISYRQRVWWRNLRGGAPVTIRVQGKDLEAVADVVEDDETVAGHLAAYLQKAPRLARYFDVRINPHGQPDPDDVARAARERVIVHTTTKEKIA